MSKRVDALIDRVTAGTPEFYAAVYDDLAALSRARQQHGRAGDSVDRSADSARARRATCSGLRGSVMRYLFEPAIARYRDCSPAIVRYYGNVGDGSNGVFRIPSPIDGAPMTVIASNGGGWDHVSVSRTSRCPNWPELEHVKRLFFRDDETAMQLHVPPSDHKSLHDYCLHLWRPNDGREIPRPPVMMVA